MPTESHFHHGFDVVIGNPPFVGGLKISELYGDRVRYLLNNCFTDVKGKADLCSLMFRRGFDLLAPQGQLGMVATNAISQGETRETGLAHIVQHGGHITWARRYTKWPGEANVEVTLLAIAAGNPHRSVLLDGEAVECISSRLDTQPESEPGVIAENRRLCFQGSIVLGAGFVLDPIEAAEIIAADPVSRICLFPYLTGEDINTHPSHEPSRWIIQFDERSEAEAQEFSRLWAIAKNRILPERRDKDAEKYPRMVHEWWKHWNNRQDLYAKVRPLSRALARSRVSELHMLAWVRTDIIYSDACVVFALDDDFHFTVLQSSIHEVWLRREASTMRTDVRYTPTDCFSTFPLPRSSDSLRRVASECGGAFYESRQRVMHDRRIGFTQLYNLIHSNSCDEEDVESLRRSMVDLDRATLELYGWSDISCDREFVVDERERRRFSLRREASEEIIRRITRLNHERTAS
jgi:hypothetical protein